MSKITGWTEIFEYHLSIVKSWENTHRDGKLPRRKVRVRQFKAYQMSYNAQIETGTPSSPEFTLDRISNGSFNKQDEIEKAIRWMKSHPRGEEDVAKTKTRNGQIRK